MRHCLSVAFAFCLSVFLAAPARAQTPTPLASWQFSAGEVLAPYDESAPKWRVILGLGAVYEPEYEGSSHYQASPSAVINIRYKSRLFLSTGEGLGYDVFRGKNYRAGASIAYDRGRDDDMNGLYGLGGIDPAPQVRVFGEYVLRPRIMNHEVPLILSAEARRAIGGYDGYTGSVGAYMPIAGSKSERYYVFLGGGVSFVDGNTADIYFSVTPAQSAASGLPVYDANALFRSAHVGINAGWVFKRHWLLTTALGAKTMIGDIQDSPVVQSEWQFLANCSIAYIF